MRVRVREYIRNNPHDLPCGLDPATVCPLTPRASVRTWAHRPTARTRARIPARPRSYRTREIPSSRGATNKYRPTRPHAIAHDRDR